jgi:uncharacterized membrane protein
MKLFLRLKHWHIFLAFLVLSYLSSLDLIIPLVIMMVLASLWFFAVGVNLHKYLQPEDQMPHRVDFFKISCFLSPILWMVTYYSSIMLQKATAPSTSYMNFIVAVGCLAAGFYMIWFTATVLVRTEPANRRGFAHKLLLMMWLLLLPIGIWFIQPKVNRVG